MKTEISKLSEDLNPSQRKCVFHGEGPAVILAGPGSGKTRVITVRAAVLAEQGKRILTMSFNKAAAVEMRERAMNFLSAATAGNCEFSTVHSFCFKLIRLFYLKNGRSVPKVLTEEKRLEALEQIMLTCIKCKRVNVDELKALSSYVSGNSGEKGKFTDMKNKYVFWKTEHNIVDYDDMIWRACEIMGENKEFAAEISAGYDYIQIDEAQDLSEKQYEVLMLLKNDNIVLVADDDQSIYGFRGAEPRLLFEFEKSHSGCKRYLLEENYRSALKITSASSEFIKNNKLRFEKKCFTEKKEEGRVVFRRFSDIERQAAETVKIIMRNYRAHRSVCVLYRNNASLLCPLVSLLSAFDRVKEETPAIIIKGEPPESKEIDLIFDIVGDVREDIHRAELKIFNHGFSGKRRFYINCLKSAADILANSFQTERSLERIYGRMKAVKEQENASEERSDYRKIFFSTIHSAKGLEFDTVVIIDLVEGELPSEDSREEAEIEEERRLAYVAITRAKSDVYLFYPEKNFKAVQIKSRFIDETQKALRTYY